MYCNLTRWRHILMQCKYIKLLALSYNILKRYRLYNRDYNVNANLKS